MDNPTDVLDQMHRPRLLVTAARFALADYRRDTYLPRLLRHSGGKQLPGPRAAFGLLLELEATLDTQRQTRAASWRIDRHVLVLCALMAEARLLAAPRPICAQAIPCAPRPAPVLPAPVVTMRPPAPAAVPVRQPKASGSAALRRAT